MAEKPPPIPPRKPTPAAKPASRASSQRRSSRPSRPAVSPEESQLQSWELAGHESGRKKRIAKSGVGQLQLTSMIDVIFLLLIYFVVTASFVENEGVLIAKLPQGSGPSSPPPELPPSNIDITLSSYDTTGCRIEVGTMTVNSFKELTVHLMAIQNNPAKGRNGHQDIDSPIIIRPAGEVRWNHVVNAFNSGLSSGYTNISFAQTGG